MSLLTRILSLVTGPAVDPLSQADVRAHLRMPASVDEDPLLEGWIRAAAETADALTGRAWLSQRWTVSHDRFPCAGDPIVLPKPPLQIVHGITYTDPAGVSQTWSDTNYRVIAPQGPMAACGQIVLRPGATYPATRAQPDAMVIEFTAGHASAEDLPSTVKAAMQLLIGHLDGNRGDSDEEIAATMEFLLSRYRLQELA